MRECARAGGAWGGARIAPEATILRAGRPRARSKHCGPLSRANGGRNPQSAPPFQMCGFRVYNLKITCPDDKCISIQEPCSRTQRFGILVVFLPMVWSAFLLRFVGFYWSGTGCGTTCESTKCGTPDEVRTRSSRNAGRPRVLRLEYLPGCIAYALARAVAGAPRPMTTSTSERSKGSSNALGYAPPIRRAGTSACVQSTARADDN